jgi:hypothetical protein
MPEPSLHPTPRSSTAGRIASLVAATVAGLIAIGLLAAGGLSLWGDSEKDRDGYLSTAGDRFETRSYAVASDDLDVDLDAPGWMVNSDRFGKIRLKATSNTGKPVFVGVAPTREVSSYLRRSAHATVTDLDSSPFRATYRDHGGDRRPAPPAEQSFWAASAHGAGTQTTTWKVRDGSWSIVVMNADGSRGVDVGVSAGASVPFLAPLGWGLVGVGLVLLVVAGGLGYLGLRPSRGGHGRVGALEPAAAG